MPDSARFALHRPEFLGSLLRGEDKIASLMSGSATSIAADTTLIEADTEHPYVYRLLKGWAGRSRLLADGRNQFILIFLPGDLFAVKSMFVVRHYDSVQVLADSIVERAHYRDLHALYVADGDVASRCMWQVMEEERRLHGWVVGLGQGTAEERMAMLLVDFRGRLALSGAIAPNALTFEMPLTQSQLADHLGITTVHVNRVLRTFRESGLVTIRAGHVSIRSLEALSEHARPLLDAAQKGKSAYVGREALDSIRE